MVSPFGRGFDSLQLHEVTLRSLTLVRVLSVASLCESGKAERDSLQLHTKKEQHRYGCCSLIFAAYLTALMVRPLKRLLERFPKCTFTFSKSNSRHQAFTGLAVYTVDVQYMPLMARN